LSEQTQQPILRYKEHAKIRPDIKRTSLQNKNLKIFVRKSQTPFPYRVIVRIPDKRKDIFCDEFYQRRRNVHAFEEE